MTFWEILSSMSDFVIVFYSTFFVLCIIAILLYSFITKTSFEDIMKAGAMADIEENECIKRLDKLQDTLDCLASKHLDAEAMRDLQERTEEAKEPEKLYVPPMTRPFDEDSFSKNLSMFNSIIDGLIKVESDCMCRVYGKLDKLSEKDTWSNVRKREKLDSDIEYSRFAIALYSFIQTHGYDAFEIYLRRMCFMTAADEAIELTLEELKMRNKRYEAPEIVELTENSEQNSERT